LTSDEKKGAGLGLFARRPWKTGRRGNKTGDAFFWIGWAANFEANWSVNRNWVAEFSKRS